MTATINVTVQTQKKFQTGGGGARPAPRGWVPLCRGIKQMGRFILRNRYPITRLGQYTLLMFGDYFYTFLLFDQ